MTMTGPLQLGVVQVTSSATGALIGYAFSEALPRGQMQRWILYQDPADAFTIAPPPATMAGWTLADWQNNLEGLWKPGSFYVWAQADVYEHGGVYAGATWTTIPAADSLPKARFPLVPGVNFQFVPPTSQTVLELASGAAQPIGLAYTLNGLHDSTNREYWMLPAGSQPAGGSSRTQVRVGTAAAPTLQSYVDLANHQWGPGSVLVIVGCVNYNGPSAPVLADAGAKAS
jgi:hypothetical protein